MSFDHGLSSSDLQIYGVRTNFTCTVAKEGDGKPVKERWWPAKRGGAEEWWRSRKEARKRRPCSEEGERGRKQKQGIKSCERE
ncbi:hypothetical protein RHGRI_027058 [Rhododendron griersonianum]|uniref:Uncharacterized protein n=1 Tax=Rhododendron griersonianum TaxID=479676 RepID=A0AAV6IYH7_9ERIC|nr:hypothetical protein RHGRI_027058 [Rhododendron griersonianum]